jgi:amino acid transporter
MKKTVLTFGLIAGAILSAMMLLTIPFGTKIGWDHMEVVGYTTMVLAFLLVFVGVRSYRDNVAGGTISFGRAVAVGALIVAIASVCYTATWQVIYYGGLAGDFQKVFHAQMVERAKTKGGTPEEIAARIAEADRFVANYQNPAVNVAFTLLEPLPVGLVIVLVSAGILRRKRGDGEPAFAGAVAARN